MGFGGSEPETDTMTVKELRKDAPLYTKTGKACCWADSGEYAFRLRQLEIINYAIKTLAEETWKDASSMPKFQDLHNRIMSYEDVDGNPADNHDWSLLSEDPTFLPQVGDVKINRFKEFQQYFLRKAGASKEQMKADFEDYMVKFINIRDSLMKMLAQKCEGQSGGAWHSGYDQDSYLSGGSPGFQRRRPISRKGYY